MYFVELCTFKFYNHFRISLIINEMSIVELKVVEVNQSGGRSYKKMMEECRPIIEKIVKGEQISNDEFNSFM